MEQKHEVSPEAKMTTIKLLAILGFITAIVFVVWASVQIIRFIPGAFSSLASMAEVVYGPKNEEIALSLNKNVVNSGEPLTLSWNKMRKNGTYNFSYKCAEGISAEARNSEGEIVRVTCGEGITLPFNAQSLDVIFSSEKKRFIDVLFAVSFTREGETVPLSERNELVTVVNATIAQHIEAETHPPAGGPETKPEVETPKPTTPPTTTVAPKPVPVVTYPISNPNGYTDLSVTYLGIGTFAESSKTFSAKSEIDANKNNAVKFEVKNVGTKTSNSWSYTITLPGKEGGAYTSPTQTALKPQERAVITVAFGEIEKDKNTDTIKIEVEVKSDTNTKNNDVSKTVKVVE